MWHVGRISHTSLQPGGAAPDAPSAIAAESKTFDGTSFVATSTPRALELREIARVIADYRHAAENAKLAGFDGVEIHAANGYLIDQFLRDGSNHRTDAYGGSIENRARLMVEVTQAVVDVWGADRVGIRLSPFSNSNAISDSNPVAVFSYAVDQLDKFHLAYLHLVEGQTGGSRDLAEGESIAALRARFHGVYMGNNGYTRDMAIGAIESGAADLIAFGRPYIANPDLAERLAINAPLNTLDPTTLYGGGTTGYTDYPALAKSKAA